tara:strand:- start:4820 stop:5584 length:765 start_codon:yes stop_codon:yes gene_type:complete
MDISRLNIPSDIEPDLTFVGVGPGDPSLLTLAAVSAIQSATIVSFPVAKKGGSSIAATIIADWVTEDKKKLPLLFPMVNEVEPRLHSWRNASNQLANVISQGEKVVFLSQGDVSIFSTSSYLLFDFQANYPQYQIRLVPGVNSFSAAAAIAQLPLILQNEQLLVLPTPDHPDVLEDLLKDSASMGRVLALLKLGKRWSWVRPLLEKLNILDKSVFAQGIGLKGEKVVLANKVEASEKPYFSLLLIRQSWPEVFP